jgi:quinol monooxygenase YgiN
MIIRIVKMSFQPEKLNEFLSIFESSKNKIRAFENCSHVELLQDINSPSVCFTYSKWENEEALEKYRKSELFKTTWAKTKVLFNQKPEAWSVHQVTAGKAE